jgi:DNA (cytosine-5)-methyltransferase 1
MEHKFNYQWTLADAKFTKDKGKVFSCFACGGGSTMGYKLAGFDVIGCNEIDPRMNKVYVENHHPKFNFLCDIRELVGKAKTHELPEELYNLDVLDGSPPCSSFSMAGVREEGWGKKKKFREGQVEQVLDTLFFDFIELANELHPKIVIAENVEGLIFGEAKTYVQKISNAFDDAGYSTTLTLCKCSEMGVPQMRRRVFFVAVRKDLEDFVPKYGLFQEPYINLQFNEEPILWGEIYRKGDCDRKLSEMKQTLWESRKEGDIDLSFCCARVGQNPNKFFNSKFLYLDKVANTVVANDQCILFDENRFRSNTEIILCSSFPLDYNFLGEKADYICGMSVPPVMMAQVASRVYEQWLSKIK